MYEWTKRKRLPYAIIEKKGVYYMLLYKNNLFSHFFCNNRCNVEMEIGNSLCVGSVFGVGKVINCSLFINVQLSKNSKC